MARSRDETAALERAVAARARRAHGVVTAVELLEAGAHDRWVAQRVRRGFLVPVHRGVYRMASSAPTWESSAAAALAAAGRSAAVSHWSAARLHDLSTPPRKLARLDVVVPNGALRRSLHGVTVHRSRSLAAVDVVVVRGLRVTSVARTLLDLAPQATREELERLLDDALLRRRTTLGRLERTLDRAGARGRGGVVALRTAAAVWGEGRYESIAETATARWLAQAGLELPRSQYEVRDSDGAFVARVDFAWPERRVALEVDGFAWHGDAVSFAADRHRQNRLVAAGWQVVRTSPRALAGGDQADTLRAALRTVLR